MVQWFETYSSFDKTNPPQPKLLEMEEMSVYDIRDHPEFRFRPGTIVIRVGGNSSSPECSAGQIVDNFPDGKVISDPIPIYPSFKSRETIRISNFNSKMCLLIENNRFEFGGLASVVFQVVGHKSFSVLLITILMVKDLYPFANACVSV